MFHDLLKNPHAIEPGRLQSDAMRQFPTVVAASHLRKRLPEGTVPDHACFVILGIATYSPAELQLLDDIEEQHDSWSGRAQVAVFDLALLRDFKELPNYAPGLLRIDATPLVMVWQHGHLLRDVRGITQARELLRKFGLLSAGSLKFEPK